jgi:prevent-host-death family protein
MDTIGTFEAKTHLTRLLDRVASGEQITITRHVSRSLGWFL